VLRRLAQTWVFNVAAIFVASAFVDGIDYADKFWVLVLAGLVFGLVNMVLKPIVKLLALPLVVLTLGAALFFINLFMLYIRPGSSGRSGSRASKTPSGGR
jgi:putative membrane protein